MLKAKIEGRNENETIAVFLDAIPGNKNIRRIYHKLLGTARQHENVIIMPIICREYYFLKSVRETKFITNADIVNEVLNFKFFRDSRFIETDEDKVFCKNFEKFCKLAVLKAANNCCSKVWVHSDCPCSNPCNSNKLSLVDKACKFVYCWECFMSGSLITDKRDILDEAGVIKLHRELVDRFNTISNKHMELDTDNRSNYFILPYQK